MDRLLPLSIACALSLAACTDRNREVADDGMPASATTAAATPATQSSPQETPMPVAGQRADGFALALLAAIDRHEIDAARQAKEKHVTGDVLAYARMVETEHDANLAQTQALGPATSDPEIDSMQAKGKAEIDALSTKSGAAYAKAYIDAMVKGHEEALAAIDAKMMPNATRDDVKQHLVETRKAVETHLARAKQVAQAL